MNESKSLRSTPVKPRRTMENEDSENEYSPVRRMHRRPDSPRNLSVLDTEPETTIGVAVKMKGDLSFERLLRIDGHFEGRLMSKGSLWIGLKGCLVGDIEGMKEVHVIGGKLMGNVAVDKLILREKAEVFGNVTAKSVRMEADCVVIGMMNVNPHAPLRMNEKGEPISEKEG